MGFRFWFGVCVYEQENFPSVLADVVGSSLVHIAIRMELAPGCALDKLRLLAVLVTITKCILFIGCECAFGRDCFALSDKAHAIPQFSTNRMSSPSFSLGDEFKYSSSSGCEITALDIC